MTSVYTIDKQAKVNIFFGHTHLIKLFFKKGRNGSSEDIGMGDEMSKSMGQCELLIIF